MDSNAAGPAGLLIVDADTHLSEPWNLWRKRAPRGDEDDGALIREASKQVGEDNCMFETDFPHPTCLYPDPVQRALKVFEPESDEVTRKVFGANAVRIYDLAVP